MPDATAQRPPSAGRKHLVLLGGGSSHLHLLVRLARHPEPGLRVTLVASAARPVDAAMLPALVAGTAALERVGVALEPLLQRSGVQRLARRVAVLDAPSRSVALDDGQVLTYDWLSIDCGAGQDRHRLEGLLPGAREHGLFLYPADVFAGLWQQVVQLPAQRLSSLVVIGPGLLAPELALALRHRLPDSAVTLVTGGMSLGAGYPDAMAACMRREFRHRRITVLEDQALGLRQGEVLLGCGARLACDVPLVVAGQTTPGWLTDSGLALDAAGRPRVDSAQRSTSHAQVMLAPDLATAAFSLPAEDALWRWHRAAHLADNIVRMVRAEAPQALPAGRQTVRWLADGAGAAIVGWGRLAWRSRWLGRWHAQALAACLPRLAQPPG